MGMETTRTARLVNCYTAVLFDGRILSTGGADGIPARAMKIARAATIANGTVVGIAIHDVTTGERWLTPLDADI